VTGGYRCAAPASPAFGDMRLRLIDSLTSEVFRNTKEFDCQYRHLWRCLL